MIVEGTCAICKRGDATGYRAYGHFAHPKCMEEVIRFVIGLDQIGKEIHAILQQHERWLEAIALDEDNAWTDPDGDRWIFRNETARWYFRHELDSVHGWHKSYPSLDAAKIELARFARLK